MICLQAPQTPVDSLDNVVQTQVVTSGKSFLGLVSETDSAFALDDDLVPYVRILRQEFAKDGFRFAKAINVRVIKKVEATFERRVDRGPSLFPLLRAERRAIEIAADHHTAIDQWY
jgi:hypothetical protein